jgi:Outer membrane protein beta-barrel domain
LQKRLFLKNFIDPPTFEVQNSEMKFFTLTIAILLLMLRAQSQVRYNIFGGLQTTSASYTAQSVKQKTSYKFGGQLGIGMKVPFETRLSFAPAIFYSMKGYKVIFSRFVYPPDVTATDNNTSFHTVETAFLLHYDFNSRPDHMFLKLGPSLDFQLLGKEKFNTPAGLVDRQLPFGYDKYGHFSANMILQLGYEMNNGFFFFGQYSHGLANINNADGGPRIRHRVFGISIGKYIIHH